MMWGVKKRWYAGLSHDIYDVIEDLQDFSPALMTFHVFICLCGILTPMSDKQLI